MRMGIPGVPSLTEWIEKNLEEGAVVGIDPFLCPIYLWAQIKSGLETSGHRLVNYFQRCTRVKNPWEGAAPIFAREVKAFQRKSSGGFPIICPIAFLFLLTSFLNICYGASPRVHLYAYFNALILVQVSNLVTIFQEFFFP
jgi:hypothetical protein